MAKKQNEPAPAAADATALSDYESASPQYDAFSAAEFGKKGEARSAAYALGARDALSWASGDLGESPAPTAKRLTAAAEVAWDFCETNDYAGPDEGTEDEEEEEEEEDDDPPKVPAQ